MKALQPKFYDVTLACDDSLTIQTHKVMLVYVTIVSRGLLRKHPYPLVYMRDRRPAPSLRTRRDIG